MRPTTGLSVRLFDLDTLGPALEAVEAERHMLSTDERTWSAATRPEVLRRRRAARIALRLALTEAGAKSAQGSPLLLEPGGKPYLDQGPAFSLSHSGQFALIAISPSGRVGVDLEGMRTTAMEIRRRTLIEAAGLALAAPRDGETDDVLAAWTRLEALAKALGHGIGRLLAMLGITATGAGHLSPHDAAANALRIAADSKVAVAALPLPPALFGAIAADKALICEEPIVTVVPIEEIEGIHSRRSGHFANS